MKREPDWVRRVRAWWHRRQQEAEMTEEMRHHLELQTQDNVDAGMDPEEARYAAVRQFGHVDGIKETCRDRRGLRWLEEAWQDARFGLRQLRLQPGFTAVVVLSLSLGIAANSTIFSFVNALLLKPLAVEAPDQLWQVWRFRANAASAVKRYGSWSRVSMAHLRANSRVCTGLAAFDGEPTLVSWNREGVGEAAQSLFVSGDFFEVCGLRPGLGRFFLPAEDRTPGSHPVVVVSDRFWRQRLGAEAQAVGRTLTINGVALTIVGVAPRDFTGVMAGVAPDLWVPFMMAPAVLHDPRWLTQVDAHSLIGLARLRPGVGEGQAAAELTVLAQQFDREFRAEADCGFEAALIPARAVPGPVRGYVSAFLATLMGAVVVVLAIACANAANLQLARTVRRRRELGLRAALGASRGRLIRQLLAESVVLAAVSGGLGVLLSVWLAGLVGRLIPSTLPLRFSVELDWRVLVFTAGAALVTGLSFGIVPAMRGTQLDLAETLKAGTPTLAVRRSRLAHALIVTQMALCLVMLVAAGLCLRSWFNARAFDPGFVAEHRVAAELNLNDLGYPPEQAKAFCARLLERVRALPGLRAAALATYLPLGTQRSNGNFQVEGQEPPPGEKGFFFEQFSVGPGYFGTMGSRVLQGREFTETDRAGAPRVAIINEAAARRYWPGQNPVGRRLYAGAAEPGNALEIVGIVQTGRYRTLGEEPRPAFYDCFWQRQVLGGTLVAHVEGAPGPALAAIRAAAQELEPRLALTRLTTLEQHLSLALFPMRTSGLLLGVLGIVALALAVSGLFGVVAYSVSQRTREIGIRVALGARRGQVARMVLQHGLRLAGGGTVAGLAGALAATRLLRGLLFGVSPVDPLIFLTVPLLLIAVCLLACWWPARRAARVDPMVALRTE